MDPRDNLRLKQFGRLGRSDRSNILGIDDEMRPCYHLQTTLQQDPSGEAIGKQKAAKHGAVHRNRILIKSLNYNSKT